MNLSRKQTLQVFAGCFLLIVVYKSLSTPHDCLPVQSRPDAVVNTNTQSSQSPKPATVEEKIPFRHKEANANSRITEFELTNNAKLLEYEQLHKRIMDPADTTVEKKYVLFEDFPQTGLGNKLQALVATFLFAMVTDRALLVDWPETQVEKQSYAGSGLTETMRMASIRDLLQTPPFDWHWDTVKGSLKSEFDQRQSIVMDSWPDVNVPEGHMNMKGQDAVESFMCGDLNSVYPQKMVAVQAWDWYGPAFQLSPVYGSIIDSWELAQDGPAGVFKVLSNYLIQPIPSIQKQIDDYKKTNFGDVTIGIQLRYSGGNPLNPYQGLVATQCARYISDTQYGSGKKVKFFVATDTESWRNKAKDALGSDNVIFRDVPVDRTSTEGVQAGLIDMLLFSQCDELIYTPGSTFGRAAAGFSGTIPYAIAEYGSCFRHLSSVPCFSAWTGIRTKLSCYSVEMDLEPWMMDQVSCGYSRFLGSRERDHKITWRTDI